MKRGLFIGALFLSWAIGATAYCAQKGILEGTGGISLRILSGFALLLSLVHFTCRFLPRLGIGDSAGSRKR